jgi:hypothetical protein
MKDIMEDAPSLEMKPGYHSTHSYPQKFVRCPESQHPSPAPSSGKTCSPSEVMRMTMGK